MALTNTAVFVQTPGVGLVQIANADASNWKTVVTAGSNGTKVTSLILTSTDTGSRIVQVAITRSSTHYILGTVTVAITAGTDGSTGTINVLTNALLPGIPVDNDGQAYLFLQSGDTLDISATTTVTSGKVVSAAAVKGDF